MNLQTIIMDANSTAYGYSMQSKTNRPKSVPSSLKHFARDVKQHHNCLISSHSVKSRVLLNMRPGAKVQDLLAAVSSEQSLQAVVKKRARKIQWAQRSD